MKANAIKWSPEALPCNNCHIGLLVRNPAVAADRLSFNQENAFEELLRAALGSEADNGYSEVMQIMYTDNYFLIGNIIPIQTNGHTFGPYYLAFLGTPSVTGTWQLQLSGHNLAINNTYVNGQLVSSTPSFRGMEPPEWSVPSSVNATTYFQPVNDEHSAITTMLASLDAGQLAGAKLSANFSDMLMGVNKDGAFPAVKEGLSVGSLNPAQQQLVLAAIKTYVSDAEKNAAAAILAAYTSELGNTYISYSGNPSLKAIGDYVRIDGPGVWIEFIVKPGAAFTSLPCYFTIWRDHKKDYNGL
jgi:hypothetical protein